MASAGCSTTKKTKSSSTTVLETSSAEKLDSASLKTVDSTSVKKGNTITVIEKEVDYDKETVIEFDTTWDVGVTNSLIDSMKETGQSLKTGWVTAADYLSAQPVIRITIREKGSRKEKYTSEANTYDSTSKSSKDHLWVVVATTREVTYKNTTKKKDVVTSGPTFFQKFKTFLLLIIIVAILIVGQYFRIWVKIWLWLLYLWGKLKKRGPQKPGIKYTGYSPPKPPDA